MTKSRSEAFSAVSVSTCCWRNSKHSLSDWNSRCRISTRALGLLHDKARVSGFLESIHILLAVLQGTGNDYADMFCCSSIVWHNLSFRKCLFNPEPPFRFLPPSFWRLTSLQHLRLVSLTFQIHDLK